MTLKELQEMIKEEFAAFQNEADDVDVSVSDTDVDVDAETGDDIEVGDEEGEETDEDILRNIYDMLKAKFEMEDEMGDEEGDDIEDVEGGEEEADIEENATTKAKFQKQGYAAGGDTKGGTNSGFGNVGGKGNDGYPTKAKSNPLPGEGSVTALQERFQKLANIIK
jgi:hypothetical protein